MKFALIGYGKMGKLVEKIALERGHCVVATISSKESVGSLNEADIFIDYSSPESVLKNIKTYSDLGKNIVVGTTGWYQHLQAVQELVKKNEIGMIYAPNFSIGVYLFMKIVEYAAEMINDYEYDVAGVEMHHNQKVDHPSGTALAIAHLLKNKNKELDFSSVRCGSIPGTHTILFDSPVDTITLTHQARNREGFALGTVLAAEWVQNKKGVFTLDDMLGNIKT